MGKRWRGVVTWSKAAALAAAFLARPAPAAACKELPRPATFPTEVLQHSPAVAVVRIDRLEPLEPRGRYAPPFRASGTVVKALKGKLGRGEVVQMVTEQGVEAHAVCPIDPQEGGTYLVFFKSGDAPYVVPRYTSYFLGEQDELFKGYVETIEKGSGGRRWGCSAARTEPDPSGIAGWLMLANAVACARPRRRSGDVEGAARPRAPAVPPGRLRGSVPT